MKENFLYRFLSLIWRNTILKWYRDYKSYKVEKYWEEHKVRRGHENPDKTFYVIRRRDLYCGLFSLLLTNLVRIDEAVKKGYIPVIDMQNDFNIYLPEDKLGRENSWEYFFRQPMGYSLTDIARSKNVIVGAGAVPVMFPYLDVKFLMGQTGEIEYWRGLVRKYIALNSKAQKFVNSEYQRLFRKDERVLGVICRGTDYVSGKPTNHPVQPTPHQAVDKAEEILREKKCVKIFLATEDAEIYKAFYERFKDNLISNKTRYVEYKGGAIGKEEYEYEQEYGNFKTGMEYLATIMLVAKCDCLCAGCVSATVGALLLTEGFEYTYLFNLGIYE